MKVFQADIEINAPIDVVWQHLIDFSGYPAWNPFVTWAEGSLQEGAEVIFKVGAQTMDYKARIVTVKPQEEFTWVGLTPVPGLTPRYIRKVEAINAHRTRFMHRDEFSGFLVPMLSPVLTRQFGPFYVPTCEALKIRAETTKQVVTPTAV